MIESMRAFGYGLPSALADLVDNSVSADASMISLTLHWDGAASWIAVMDDGHGMDQGELRNAMRLGSRSPREHRSPGDLGRFGLGLKTAAFSQGRSLTVASKRVRGARQVRRWDLDHVTATSSWSLLTEPAQGSGRHLDPLETIDHGTLVLIERLDRLTGDSNTEDAGAQDQFLHQIERVREHLAMVFHRFLAGPNAIRVAINGLLLEPWDPFLSGTGPTQQLPDERFSFRGGTVLVRPYVLPHFSKLDTTTHRRGAGPRGWNDHQGFYVYRERRLIVSGDWLGLPRMQKEEHYKLARIRVDLDNSMDLAWQLDVRKATARIPAPLRVEFRRIANAARRQAAEAYRYRGKRLARTASKERAFVWIPRVRSGSVSYHVDRAHPLIESIVAESPSSKVAVDRVLRVVEETLPVMSILMDCREEPDGVPAPFQGRTGEVEELMRAVHHSMVDAGATPTAALEALARLEPFDAYPELVATLAEELTK